MHAASIHPFLLFVVSSCSISFSLCSRSPLSCMWSGGSKEYYMHLCHLPLFGARATWWKQILTVRYLITWFYVAKCQFWPSSSTNSLETISVLSQCNESLSQRLYTKRLPWIPANDSILWSPTPSTVIWLLSRSWKLGLRYWLLRITCIRLLERRHAVEPVYARYSTSVYDKENLETETTSNKGKRTKDTHKESPIFVGRKARQE